LSARAGLASPSEKKVMLTATNTELRTTILLLSGDAPAAQRGFRGRDTRPRYGTKSGAVRLSGGAEVHRADRTENLLREPFSGVA